MKTFTARVYYSTFCTRTVQADDEGEAIQKARSMDFDDEANNEILNNLDPWKDCDELFEGE